MEHMKTALVEKFEQMLGRGAKPCPPLEAMSLGEVLYYALVESGQDRSWQRDGALQEA